MVVVFPVVFPVVLVPTEVQIQITISQYSYIDYSHQFVGSALARFERSTFPEHEGTKTVVLRFVKTIIPAKCVIPNYDGYICCPKEGELYQKLGNGARQKVWSVNIDQKQKRFSSIEPAIQLLWDE